MDTIAVYINGKERFVQSVTVDKLLEELQLAGRKIAVELNREIVSRSSYPTAILKPGDMVEIVQFVGGG